LAVESSSRSRVHSLVVPERSDSLNDKLHSGDLSAIRQ
jgi:hypothetical protein